MRRRKVHARPSVEPMEPRELLSNIIAANIAGANRRLHQPPPATIGVPPFNSPPKEFGGTINNLLFAPDPNGVPSKRQQRAMTFTAVFTGGSYGIGPGRFSNEASHTYMRSLGTSNQMLHCSMQYAFVQPKDRTQPATGEIAIQDKNLSTGNQLAFFTVADPGYVDRQGRPTRFLMYEKDVNQSSAFYDQGSGVGTMDIKYFPEKRNRQGTFESGGIKMLLRAQVYNLGTTAFLTNSYSYP